MNWEDERYVRLYTRDSTTWLKWTWEARATFTLLLRKVARSGLLPIDGESAADIVALHTGLPVDVVERGMAQITRPGKDGTATVIVTEDAIRMVNYTTAQTVRSSDAKRAREYRERATVTERDGASQNVTGKAGSVTDRHTPSPAVTARHSSGAVLSGAVLSGASAPNGAGAVRAAARVASRKKPRIEGTLPETSGGLVLVPPDPKPATQPLPFDARAACDEAARHSAGRFLPPPRLKDKHCIGLIPAIRQYPDLRQWAEVGKWLAAGGESRRPEITIGIFVASIEEWFPFVIEWCKAGRKKVERTVPAVQSSPAPGAHAGWTEADEAARIARRADIAQARANAVTPPPEEAKRELHNWEFIRDEKRWRRKADAPPVSA